MTPTSSPRGHQAAHLVPPGGWCFAVAFRGVRCGRQVGSLQRVAEAQM